MNSRLWSPRVLLGAKAGSVSVSHLQSRSARVRFEPRLEGRTQRPVARNEALFNESSEYERTLSLSALGEGVNNR